VLIGNYTFSWGQLEFVAIIIKVCNWKCYILQSQVYRTVHFISYAGAGGS